MKTLISIWRIIAASCVLAYYCIRLIPHLPTRKYWKALVELQKRKDLLSRIHVPEGVPAESKN
jgi:hypothetical protein